MEAQERQRWWHGVRVLGLLLCVYILNQADRQLLPILISAGLKCGNGTTSHHHNGSGSSNGSSNVHGFGGGVEAIASTAIAAATPANDCLSFSDLLEGLIKGPAFTVVYTVFGVSLSYLADHYNRTYVLAAAVGIWSLATCLSYVVKAFYQLMILRVVLGIGEAVCNPVAYSLIADCFPLKSRATALSVYHLGVYIGNALGYVAASAYSVVGWRLTFVIFGAPGFLFALLFATVVREPERGATEIGSAAHEDGPPKAYNLISLFRHAKGTPAFYTIVAASSIRQIAGLSLGAYLPSFFKDTFNLDDSEYNHTMLVVGMIVLTCGSAGAMLGLHSRRHARSHVA
ncbi:hypothetical protein PTSG_06612 [Salpingoeca rosetta]|uniref:Major facilitator superfamily (MFS) profile domain-containing protein n=1 Tax=Salpingoeca rosetta (strain ATCC 50818 / BSB-021) TaxID=946362 RepID=F2UFH4_SALR5|nr:uncharacterized protein PTSG_06612 [Salpingoeca rosetta]EGD75542.1 hypothetical protein PTSG_06612 [Salpingoeca rosetta]|eukprot:XP_004991999.1 hypothetical protein PTSG_06612 [Salpingoeca rosetta]